MEDGQADGMGEGAIGTRFACCRLTMTGRGVLRFDWMQASAAVCLSFAAEQDGLETKEVETDAALRSVKVGPSKRIDLKRERNA